MIKGKIHFIGGGQMAEAIIRACIAGGTLAGDQISVSDINEGRLQHLKSKYSVDTESTQEQGLQAAELIIIAVRPQDDLTALGAQVRQSASPAAAIISIVAG